METDYRTVTTILSARRHEAVKMLAKFEKKAKRYGVPFTYSLGEPYEQERREQTDNMWYPNGVRTYKVSVIDVTIEGEKPVVGDYEFLASIEFANEAGNFVDMVPGAELPAEYRHTDDRCEHCNAARRRKHVFVVRNRETSELMQVGRTCLRDFLGTDDPKWIVQRFKFFRELEGFDEEEGWGGFGGGSWWADELRRVLGIATASIRLWGWVSKGNARFDEDLTPTVARYWLHEDSKAKGEDAIERDKLRAEVKPEDYQFAEEVIAWVRASTEDSDYMHNLRVAMHDDVLTDPKRLGLAVSAVSAYYRHLDKEIKRAKRKEQDAQSEHQGTVGERLRGLRVRLEMRRGMGDNGWGWTELLKMRDEQGNLYTWFTGAAESVGIGEDLIIDGTVKRHTEYQGTKETQLTRVKMQ